jgi:hypothetical protein
VRGFRLESIFQRGLLVRTLVVLCRGLFMFVFYRPSPVPTDRL